MKFLNLSWLFPVILVFMPLSAVAASFRVDGKVYITDLKPQTKVKIPVERITFSKVLVNQCGEASFTSKSLPSGAIVNNNKILYPAKFLLDTKRKCTKGSPKSSKNYKSSSTNFIIAGLKPDSSVLIKTIKPTLKNINTTKCGYGAIAITSILTGFSNSYEQNLYSVNGMKLTDIPTAEVAPQCKK
jgi:hypothetical protein